MTEPPHDDPSPTGSAPWERPGRWHQQRLDVTRVDDLLARLGNEDDIRGRRGRRRDAERAAQEATAAASQVPTEDQAPPHDGDDPASIPVGDLIAALAGSTADQDATITEATDPATADTGTAVRGDVAPQDDTADQDDTATAGDAFSAAASNAAAPSISDPAAAVATDHGVQGVPGRVTAPGMDDHVTDQLPKVVEQDVASIRASLRLQTGDTSDSDDTSADVFPGAVTAAGVPADAADSAGPADPGGPAGPGGPLDPPRGSGSAGRVPDEPEDRRRRPGFLAAGRSAIAAVAVAVLLLTGYEWNTLQNTEAGLKETSGDYLATADPAISTPSTTHTQPTTPGAKAAAATTSPLPLYPPENILLLGSDSRADGNGNSGNSDASTADSANSDTMMIAHLSADRQHIAIVSFPRYLWVKAPSCQTWDFTSRKRSGVLEKVTDSTRWKISNAYAVGGPACSVLAVQGVTGLRIDRVIDIDFKGFKDMVDALQGVEVNVCRPIIDKELQTVVAQGGEQLVTGDQALSLVRARQVEGDSTGTDGRMRRQQVVLAAMLRQVTSAGTLLNPPRLNSFLKAFVNSTHNANVTLDSLLVLAKQLGNLDPGRVTFYSVPHTEAPQERELLAPGAQELFAALRDDSLLPGETVAPASSAAASSTGASTSASRKPSRSTAATSSSPSSAPAAAPQTLTVDPAAIDLRVVNLTGRKGVAGTTMNSLNKFGFNITDSDLSLPPGPTADGVTVEFAPANRAAALTVAAAVPGAALVEVPELGKQVRLMLGTSYDGAVKDVSVGQDVPSRYRTTPPTTAVDPSPTGASPDRSTTKTSTQSTSTQSTSTQSTSTLSTKELGALNAGDATCA